MRAISIDRLFRLLGTSRNKPGLIGRYARQEHAHFDESLFVSELLSDLPAESVMIDIGAHHGAAFASFIRRKWRIFTFEPDPINRQILLERVKGNALVSVDGRAISDQVLDSVPFYSSNESTGISTLAPFRDSHRKSCHVSTTTLAAIADELSISQVDFLKIDTEGYDLMVLKGVPWSSWHPRVIECEFEDNKTVPLGYDFHRLARFLTDKGYTVIVSEWHPIIRYGIKHDWRRLVLYPCELGSDNAWGNLIAFRDPPDLKKVASTAQRHRKVADPKPNCQKLQPSTWINRAVTWGRRLAHFYSRWPGAAGILAIGLYTLALVVNSNGWLFVAAGTGLMLFLIGYAATSTLHELSVATSTLRQELNKATAELEKLHQIAAVQEKDLKKLHAQETLVMDQFKATVEEGRKENQALHNALVREEETRNQAMALERAKVVSSFARRDSSSKMPSKCILVVSPQRAGSTWLFDALRCHPKIFVEPRALITEALGMDQIYRYPAGLSNGSDGTFEMELKPGYGARIPEFSPEPHITKLGNDLGVERYAIEKIHPQFYRWDPTRLARKLESLTSQHGVTFHLVYRIRNPRDTIVSMLTYKKRDPAWSKSTPDEDVPDLMLRNFKSIGVLINTLPGTVVSYEKETVDPINSLAQVFLELWPNSSWSVQAKIARWAHEKTRREKRTSNCQTPFFGESTSDSANTDTSIVELLDRHKSVVEACHQEYMAILERTKTSG